MARRSIHGGETGGAHFLRASPTFRGAFGWAKIVLLLMAGLAESRADSVMALSGSPTVSPGTPVDALELGELGIDLNLFLFTGNTLYGADGLSELAIIADNVDPSIAGSLNNLATQTIVTLDDSGNVAGVTSSGLAGISTGVGSNSIQQQAPSGTPEPASAMLCFSGLLLVAWRVLRAAGAPAPGEAPVSGRDP